MEPEIFAPGFISTGLDELNSVFHPNGEEFYFAVDVGPRFVLMMSRYGESGWTEPEVLDFSRRHSAVDLAFTADGDRMLFCSNRPRLGGIQPEEDYDIWWVERLADASWGEPRPLEGGVNTDRSEFYPSLTDDGWRSTFFREGGGLEDRHLRSIVVGEYAGRKTGRRSTPIAVREMHSSRATKASWSSSHRVMSGSPTRDGSSSAFARPTVSGPNPETSAPPPTGPTTAPPMSPDGRFFFFTGTRTDWDRGGGEVSYSSLLAGLPKPQNGQDDIYWVDAEFVTRLRPAESRALM